MISLYRRHSSNRLSRRPYLTRIFTSFVLIAALGCTVATVTALVRNASARSSMAAGHEQQRQPAAKSASASMPVLTAVVAGTTITVNTVEDVLPVDGSDGKCTLREAITAANTNTALSAVPGECEAGSGDDTIIFNVSSPQTINLKGALPFINNNLIVFGPGANLLTIRRDTGGDYNIFNVSHVVTISRLTISNGFGTGGGGLSNGGTLTIDECVISGNAVGGGTGERNGGGIYNSSTGTLTINNSTISGNTANATGSFFSFGGGIYSDSGATLTILNSTISGNNAKDNGGGVVVFGGQAKLTNVTITNNHSNTDDNGGNQGGGLMRFTGTVLLNNTLIAGNFQGSGTTTPQDVGGFSFDPASSNNLIGADAGNSGLTNGVSGNQVGTSAAPINARLAPLADNGGVTQTHALLPGSPALDAGNNSLAKDANNNNLPTDQRGMGYPRATDAADLDTVQTVDIGAFEAYPSIEDITDKTITEDSGLSYSFRYGDKSIGIQSVTRSSSNTALVPNGNILCDPFASSCSDLIVPPSNQSGSATITITIKAVNDQTISDTFTLTVTPVNDAPSAANDTLTNVAEDSATRTIAFSDLTANDSPGPADESGQSLAVNSVFNANGGTVSISGSDVLFTPAPNYSGAASFQYSVVDNGTTNGSPDPKTSSSLATVSFNITEINDPPLANPDILSNVAEDSGQRTISFSTLTANDFPGPSPETGQTFTVKSVSNPVGGTVSISGSNVLFTPTANHVGAASFQYTIEDNGTTNGAPDPQTSAPAGVAFNIDAVADTPSVTNASTNEDTQTTSGLVVTPNPADGSEVPYFKVTGITNGTLYLSNGTTPINEGDFLTFAQGGLGLKFTPAANFSGLGSFTVQASTDNHDTGLGGSQVTATISVNPVNDAPVADAQSLTTAEETSKALTLTGTDIDTPVPNLTFSVVSAPSHGVLSGTGANLTYKPDANYSGPDSFSFKANDGTLDSAPATVSITVTGVNDAPINTVPGPQAVPYPNTLTFSADNGNAISVADSDAGTGQLRVSLSVTGGSLTLSTMSGLVFLTGDGTQDSDITFAGTLADINAALNGLAYKPAQGFNGAATLTITTNDQGNSGAGGALTATSTIDIMVQISVVQFGAPSYTIAENGGSIAILVARTAPVTSAVTVNYQTSDNAGLQNCNVINGIASPRCDYVGVVGTLHFAPGESSKTIFLPVVDDTYAEGTETFTISLMNPTGGVLLGAQSTATITITDNGNDGVGAANPIDDTNFFVRQHYIDFLGREPDPASVGWLNQINNCVPSQPSCDRLSVSQGIYGSPEFKDRGYFIYKFFSVAFGRKPSYDEFVVDRARVSGFQTEAELEQSKVDFISDFMGRAEFAIYNGLTDDQYVQRLFTIAGVTQVTVHGAVLDVAAMQQSLQAGKTRATVLREIVESPEVSARFLVESTIVMHYFGYLRRDPDAAYQDWINIFNQTGDARNVTNGFVNSQEYRARFGQ